MPKSEPLGAKDFICKSCWKVIRNASEKANIILLASCLDDMGNDVYRKDAQYEVCAECFGEMLTAVEIKASDIVDRITNGEIPTCSNTYQSLNMTASLVNLRIKALEKLYLVLNKSLLEYKERDRS